MNVSYGPGPHLLMVGPAAVVLLDTAADAPLVDRLWPLVESAADLPAVLDALLVDGLSALPDFALLVCEPAPAVLLRGEATVDLGDDVLDGRDAVSWREATIDAGTSRVGIRLSAEPAGTVRLPCEGGVLFAGAVQVDLGSRPDSRRRAVRRPAPVAAVPDEPAPTGRGRKAGAAEPATAVPAVTFGAAATADPAAALDESAVDLGTSDLDADLPEGEAPDEDVPNYDHMFHTVGPEHAALLQAALSPAASTDPDGHAGSALILPGDEADDDVTAAEAVEPPVAEPDPTPLPVVPAQPSVVAVSSGLIDAVPWASPGPSHSSTPAPATARVAVSPVAPALASAAQPDLDVEVDDATVSREQHQHVLAQLAASADRVGPLVHAVTCEAGHLNDPQRDRCRICSSPIPETAPVTVPRPVLGQLRLSTGDVVQLDRGVVLGRNPKGDKAAAERPHLVQVDNKAGDVSRSHVSVVLDGWHVLVKDLRSTNGTYVQLPGEQPQRLRPEEPVPLEPGACVVLADGVSFSFEVTA